MKELICKTCTLRHTCNFYKELRINLQNLTSMVSKEAKPKIENAVAEDIQCGGYVKEEQ